MLVRKPTSAILLTSITLPGESDKHIASNSELQLQFYIPLTGGCKAGPSSGYKSITRTRLDGNIRREIGIKIFLIASNYFSNELVGYGFTHIPSSPGWHSIEVSFLVSYN